MDDLIEKKDETLSKSKETDLIEILQILWSKKLQILFFTIFISVFSGFFTFFLSDIYKSEAVLAAANDGEDLSSLPDSLGSLAGVAGISLGDIGGNKVSEALEIMVSLNFFERLMSKNNLFYELNASKGWNKNSAELIIDPKVFDSKNQKWISKKNFTINGKPSLQSAHREFLKKFKAIKSNSNGFVTLSMEHYSPIVAQKTLTTAVEEINKLIRDEDINLAENSISFLKLEASKTSISEVKRGIYGLIEAQVEKIALANASPDYVFKILSKPIAPEKKFKYSKLLIILTSSLFALFFSIIYFTIKEKSPYKYL